MGRKKVLEKRMQRLTKKIAGLADKANTSNDAAEVRKINEMIAETKEEIEETQEEIDCLDEPDDPTEPVSGNSPNPPLDPTEVQQRGGNPLASYGLTAPQQEQQESTLASMEYRRAFMDYVQRGVPIPTDLTSRAGGDPGPTVTEDIGVIVPETIMNEFIKKVSKVYGQIYSKVRKLNVKGGVKFPISDLKANFKWINEKEASGRQKAGDVKEFVLFSYHIGEIRVSQSLLSQVVSLDLFESEITRIMVEAYVEMMDKVIISGTGENQPLGITKDSRVSNVVEFTAAEFAKWDVWRKKLFAIIPLSKRGQGEFLFPSSTVESQLLTMKDNNERPVFKEATEITMGTDGGKFYGRPVTLVEPDIVADFDTAVAGDVVGIYWVPGDYAVNTNLQFGVKKYFDEDKNEWVNKGLTIVDGKILDTTGCYLIKKK